MSEPQAADESPAPSDTAKDAAPKDAPGPSEKQPWGRPVLLFVLTLISTTWVGAEAHNIDLIDVATRQGFNVAFTDFLRGWEFSIPLMTILVAHELGHYLAGRIHHVDISPPQFIPMPLSMLGTMGAVIGIDRIDKRNALLDIGAAGPLAGFAVALPLFIFGVIQSPILPVAPGGAFIIEGHSILYELVVYALKGAIPEGFDIFLTPTAFAAWAGFLVTMINLIPSGQLDGGHIAYALFGPAQNRYSRIIRNTLPFIALATSGWFAFAAWSAGSSWERIQEEAQAGASWVLWFVVLNVMAYWGERDHPPTEDGALSPKRRLVAVGTLFLFVLLFMPAWARHA